jgi:hypothetical protein
VREVAAGRAPLWVGLIVAVIRHSSEGTRFSGLLDDYITKHVEGDGLRSNSTLSYLEVLRKAFGEESVERLAKSPHLVEDWLQEQAKTKKWSAANYNRYLEHGRALFNWAMRRGLVTANPFLTIAARPTSGARERRITPDQEAALLDSCAVRLAVGFFFPRRSRFHSADKSRRRPPTTAIRRANRKGPRPIDGALLRRTTVERQFITTANATPTARGGTCCRRADPSGGSCRRW